MFACITTSGCTSHTHVLMGFLYALLSHGSLSGGGEIRKDGTSSQLAGVLDLAVGGSCTDQDTLLAMCDEDHYIHGNELNI